jgi:hypothetical protein
MRLPVFAARVEQRDELQALGIEAAHLIGLKAVAHPAGQPQIVGNGQAAARSRLKMLEFQRAVQQFLFGETIAATIAGLLDDELPERRREINGSRRERLSQAAADGFGQSAGFEQLAGLIELHQAGELGPLQTVDRAFPLAVEQFAQAIALFRWHLAGGQVENFGVGHGGKVLQLRSHLERVQSSLHRADHHFLEAAVRLGRGGLGLVHEVGRQVKADGRCHAWSYSFLIMR